MGWLHEGPPVPEIDGWRPVRDPRAERAEPAEPVDFDLLFAESVLRDAGIECVYYPYRPNDVMVLGASPTSVVRLYVPEARYEEAEQLIAEAMAAPIDWQDAENPAGDDEPGDAGAGV